jgi:LysM repeat protein
MKRKLILSVFMIMICAGLIFLVKGFQEKAAVIPQPQQQTSAVQEAVDTAASEADAASDAGSSGAAASEKPGTSEGSTVEAAEPAEPAKDSGPAKNSSAGSGTAATAPATATAETQKKASPNFTVYDSVSGTFLASIAADIKGGDTVAAVTMEALDGDCRATGSGDSIYFSRIMGISEKSEGPMSGWCFYVNGQKPGLSAGSYKLKAGDTVEWKFLQDGTNN